MSFLKKLFGGKKENPKKQTMIDKGVSLSVKEEKSEFKYVDFNAKELENVRKTVEYFDVAFSKLLQFDIEPANHPENLDEYLTVWGSSGFDNFMGMEKGQHIAFLSYGFGQFMCDKYGFKWQVKSDGYGEQTVIRMTKPAVIELYPVDSTLRAIETKKLAIYVEIDNKLNNSLKMLNN